MRLAQVVHAVSPELVFGLVQTLVWLLLALEVTAGVVAPLARGLGAALPTGTPL